VRVLTVAQTLAPDGGTQVGLLPVTSPVGGDGRAQLARAWRSGMWGTVTLTGTTRSLIEVPTRALILDRAHWWVLVWTPQGEERRQVVPGDTHGWMTAIASGLDAGERVVVENAYLEFHRGISRHYLPPD